MSDIVNNPTNGEVTVAGALEGISAFYSLDPIAAGIEESDFSPQEEIGRLIKWFRSDDPMVSLGAHRALRSVLKDVVVSNGLVGKGQKIVTRQEGDATVQEVLTTHTLMGRLNQENNRDKGPRQAISSLHVPEGRRLGTQAVGTGTSGTGSERSGGDSGSGGVRPGDVGGRDPGAGGDAAGGDLHGAGGVAGLGGSVVGGDDAVCTGGGASIGDSGGVPDGGDEGFLEEGDFEFFDEGDE